MAQAPHVWMSDYFKSASEHRRTGDAHYCNYHHGREWGDSFDAQFFSEYPSKRKAGEIPPAYLMERIVGMNTQVVVAHVLFRNINILPTK